MGQLDAQESRSVGRHSSSQGRAKARKESLDTSSPIDFSNDTSYGGFPLCALQPRLDSVDGEDGDPHGHSSGSTSTRHSAETELTAFRSHLPLDILVGGKVGGAAGAVSRQSGHRAPKDAADSAFFVQLPDNIDAPGVAGFLAGEERLLSLDLEEHFDSFEGCGDQRHGDGGEEAGSRDLRDREGCVFLGLGGEAFDQGFAGVEAPEGDGDWEGGRVLAGMDSTGEGRRGGRREEDLHMGVTPTSGALTPA
jgi:hypothetical protein